jgi:hypothetical protein
MDTVFRDSPEYEGATADVAASGVKGIQTPGASVARKREVSVPVILAGQMAACV